MPTRIKYLLLLLLSLISQSAWALPTVTVMADSNVSIAIAEIARRYSRDRDVIVNVSFSSAETQEMQITEGGAADILITPNQAWIDELKNQGLIDIYSQALVAQARPAPQLATIVDNSSTGKKLAPQPHPSRYNGVAIAGDNMDEARKFLEYLKSDTAKAVFKAKGFLTD
jgi:ABC-type molybdate transport system substrate-binding protein